jgi:hypothetical protein
MARCQNEGGKANTKFCTRATSCEMQSNLRATRKFKFATKIKFASCSQTHKLTNSQLTNLQIWDTLLRSNFRVSSSQDLRLRVSSSESPCVSQSPPCTTCVSESPPRSLCVSPSLLLAQPASPSLLLGVSVHLQVSSSHNLYLATINPPLPHHVNTVSMCGWDLVHLFWRS